NLVRDAKLRHDKIAGQKEIKLILDIPATEYFVQADPDLLGQVFDNLISNAIKYAFPNTAVTIAIEPVKEKIQIQVKDEGQGLTEDDLKNLFGKYQRLSAQPTANESSVGLGLYIVKKMITAMNGKVFATSPGKHKGSIFTVELQKI
ncbi:MAG: ATP-binding protein, partial [Chloroflexota bacterium]